MEDRLVSAISINDASQVAEARRFAAAAARTLAFTETEAGKLAIVVTETATNLLKHAREGEVLISTVERGGKHGISILAIDRGPGISNISESLRDGFSSAGSSGTGLGAIRRLSSGFEIYSTGDGTAMLLRVWPGGEPLISAAKPVDIGGISVAKPGEELCGDAWGTRVEPPYASVMVADGLGHGDLAAEAAAEALRVFRNTKGTPAEVLEAAHEALRPTRGAAAAIAEIDTVRRVVRFAGTGNISAWISGPERRQNMVSIPGTLGHEVRKTREFYYAWPEGAIMVLHSDGISQHIDFARYPGLLAKSASMIAGVLHRDYVRRADDSTVVVLKDRNFTERE
jgi:anti-sigma regulatory factor (Ser/Thr protein kinase)